MSDHHNGAPNPAPRQFNDHLHPDDRFPGINYPYEQAPPPYNADAEAVTEQDPRRQDPNFFKQVGGRVLGWMRHGVHAIGHDIHETWHESTQGLISDPSRTRGAQRHLAKQQHAQLEGRHPDVKNEPFASHQSRAVGSTLRARLERVDKLAQKVGIIVETIAPAKEVLDTWPEEYQSFLDPRNIITLRDTYLGMPMGNIKGLPPSRQSRMEEYMLDPLRTGGFKELPEELQRAYLGMARDVAAHPEEPGEHTPRNIVGTHDDEGAHFLAMIDYVDRALKISVTAPAEFQALARQITERPIEADRGIADRIRQYHVRLEQGVYAFPARQNIPYSRNEQDMERLILDRIRLLNDYVTNFETRITDPSDRDWNLADPYRTERDQLNVQLRQLRNGKRTR